MYDALTAEDKKDVVEVERVLLAAYSVDAYTAYELFTKRKLCDGEKADVFLADLRRLVYLANYQRSLCVWRLLWVCQKSYHQDFEP